jgi:methylmalonyl-CoA mutase N-terminal domain/subunit
MYVALADRTGVPRARVGGTSQNDILKEYQAQKEYVFPPRPSLRLVTDTIRFCAAELPRWHPVSISGYHIREAGSTAAHELAFTLANGFAYVESAIAAGLDVDTFAPRLSFFFNAHIDFFEEIAKYRAARRIWARWMRDRYGARDARSQQLRFHTQTAGVSLTAQQPEVNIARVAIEALAGVLGGTQSLHTDAYDEALALPTEAAARIALRTQQAEACFDYIAELGSGSMLDGVVEGIERGWFQGEIADAAYAFQRKVQGGEWILVGVNGFTDGATSTPPTLYIDPAVESRQLARLEQVKADRNDGAVTAALARVSRDARQPTVNLFPALLEAVSCFATVGEITHALELVFGSWTERATA